jgi:hypothetical protein
VIYSLWFFITSRTQGVTCDAFRYQVRFDRDAIIENSPDKVEVFGGVIELPEFFPIRVPRRVRAGLGLVFLCVVPIHQGMVPRSDSIFAILCTLPANHIILHRVNEGDLCYQFSLHREEGLVDKVLVSLIALGIHKVTNLV